MAAQGLPRPNKLILSKKDLINSLAAIDSDQAAKNRVLAMESDFRSRIGTLVNSLPTNSSSFSKFNTSPYVLLIHSSKNQYGKISQIEHDILPAKEFSSMETSAGRMIEEVVLPVYGWSTVPSSMHSSYSALDGKNSLPGILNLVTLKSGPRCLNDEMSENFADAIISHLSTWANDHNVTNVEFNYGVLYGTKKVSNKKDWHILRNLRDKLPAASLTVSPNDRWDCEFIHNGITCKAKIQVGLDWWTRLGGSNCFIEVFTAMIRACVLPGASDPQSHSYTISDIGDIVSTSSIPGNFNVAILQSSQIPWLFLCASHFCDKLVD